MAEPARHYSAKTLAAHWNVSPGLIYKLCKIGELPHLLIGTTIRITRDLVAEYEARQCQNANIELHDTGSNNAMTENGRSAGPKTAAQRGYLAGRKTLQR